MIADHKFPKITYISIESSISKVPVGFNLGKNEIPKTSNDIQALTRKENLEVFTTFQLLLLAFLFVCLLCYSVKMLGVICLLNISEKASEIHCLGFLKLFRVLGICMLLKSRIGFQKLQLIFLCN